MEVIAHRGASRERPENTVAAFRRALELGAQAIELDVHATRDGVVVVHHDAVPRASTAPPELAGRPIRQLTAAELATFRVGGEPIPTLDAVLEEVVEQVALYVEIKAQGIEELVVSCLARARGPCAVHSFDHRAVARVRELAPGMPTGILLASYLLDPVAPLRQTGARDYWCEWSLIDRHLVDEIHAAGGRLIAWTVNEAAEAAALAELGVEGICSDDVSILLPAAEGS